MLLFWMRCFVFPCGGLCGAKMIFYYFWVHTRLGFKWFFCILIRNCRQPTKQHIHPTYIPTQTQQPIHTKPNTANYTETTKPQQLKWIRKTWILRTCCGNVWTTRRNSCRACSDIWIILSRIQKNWGRRFKSYIFLKRGGTDVVKAQPYEFPLGNKAVRSCILATLSLNIQTVFLYEV